MSCIFIFYFCLKHGGLNAVVIYSKSTFFKINFNYNDNNTKANSPNTPVML